MMNDDGIETPLLLLSTPENISISESSSIISSKNEIVNEVKKQMKLAGPLMAVNFLLFALQIVSVMFVGHLGELPLSRASGATSFASVTGFSLLGAFVNLGAYYLVGIPSSLLLAFVYHFGGKGLWTGIMMALIVQAICLLLITLNCNWDKEAKKATDRLFKILVN